jgi:hypothetical protein
MLSPIPENTPTRKSAKMYDCYRVGLPTLRFMTPTNPHIVAFEWLVLDDGKHLRRGLRDLMASIRRGDFVGRPNSSRRLAVSRALATLLERRNTLTSRQRLTLIAAVAEIGRHNLTRK